MSLYENIKNNLKESDIGYDYWGSKEMTPFSGPAYIEYYGGPGHLEYVYKSGNGRYRFMDFSNGDPYVFDSYEDALKVQQKLGGEILSYDRDYLGKDLEESSDGQIEFLNSDTVFDELGSDWECVVAMYGELGYDIDDEFLYEKIIDDIDNEKLYIKDNNFVLNKDGKTVVCSGRASDNIPIVYTESSIETKKNRKPIKLDDNSEQAYMNYVKDWMDERDFNWKDELSYWSGKNGNYDISDFKKMFDGLYDENGINGELFASYDEFLNNEYQMNESSTEDYWDATEIARDGFSALLKFNFGSDANGNNYIITVDNSDRLRFYAQNDEEAIQKYNNWKKDKANDFYDYAPGYDKIN